MKNLTLLLASFAMSFATVAQTAGGQAFRIDYDEFQDSGAIKYLNTPYAEEMNTGDELTAMCWMQLRDIGDNQKLMGRFNLDNSGFVLGVNQFRVYPEVWNPIGYDPQDFGFMNPLEQWWYHVGMTYVAGDALRVYLNGEEVGSVPVTDNPITSNEHDFIMGVSPWADFNSFQTFGNMDEVAVFNVALTPDQIRQAMHAGLDGSEEGLVLGYNFDGAGGEDTPELSSDEHTASGVNFSGSEWVMSTAPIATDHTANAADLRAVWNGKSLMDPRFTASSNGLNLIASGLDTTDYFVFGHDGGSGSSEFDNPADAPADFLRTARVWPINGRGAAPVDIVFNLADAAGGGPVLTDAEPAVHYTLLWREVGETTFVPVAQASSISAGIVTFSDYAPFDGEIAIGVGSAAITPNAVSEIDQITDVRIYPNPSNGMFELQLETLARGQWAQVEVLNAAGAVLHSEAIELIGTDTSQVIDLRGEGAGVYVVKVVIGGGVVVKRVVVE